MRSHSSRVAGGYAFCECRFASANAEVLLVGCKCDSTEERDVTLTEAHEFAHHYGIKYFDTSSRTGAGVDDVFLTAIKRIRCVLILF